EAGFYEEYHQERQDFGAAVNTSQWHYPMSEMRAALQQLAATNSCDAGEGIMLEYTNRVTGGSVMPTIACHMQLLRPGEKTRARRRVCCTNYHVWRVPATRWWAANGSTGKKRMCSRCRHG